ncbi:hypothetical protein [Paraburkholderia fungorum]|uniref:hypothetical protein n=1 Tax=Paraburkholderia fungorum TaxID=134537 RepID=UPI001F1F4E2B|nr:hypothetical protein [Paraburkholderia fungorum]
MLRERLESTDRLFEIGCRHLPGSRDQDALNEVCRLVGLVRIVDLPARFGNPVDVPNRGLQIIVGKAHRGQVLRNLRDPTDSFVN